MPRATGTQDLGIRRGFCEVKCAHFSSTCGKVLSLLSAASSSGGDLGPVGSLSFHVGTQIHACSQLNSLQSVSAVWTLHPGNAQVTSGQHSPWMTHAVWLGVGDTAWAPGNSQGLCTRAGVPQGRTCLHVDNAVSGSKGECSQSRGSVKGDAGFWEGR